MMLFTSIGFCGFQKEYRRNLIFENYLKVNIIALNITFEHVYFQELDSNSHMVT